MFNNSPLYKFFANDHQRIDDLLNRATANLPIIDMELYEAFRIGILTHIKMEEKILFLAAQRANANIPLPLAAQLRLEHGAITALMVPTPNEEILKVLRYLLAQHDLKEEKKEGMYEQCEALVKLNSDEILNQLKQVKPTPLQVHNDAPIALEAAKRALLRAGHNYEEISKL